jgi:transposase InsO family protein
MTGYSKSQLTRLIKKKKQRGIIAAETVGKNKFPRIYDVEDVALLIETDKAHDRLSGPATKRIFARMYEAFRDNRFARLSKISVSHIYNLRKKRQYLSQTHFFTKTKPASVPIGERRKPAPEGRPGFIRVDTIHQGDLDKEKGVYHINLIDEVTQWEIVAACEKISEYFLLPVLEEAIAQFPFKVLGFHSDNGSEYINRVVAKLLNKLLAEQTKSRTRHCNDNALVEGKNGSVVRKHMGRNFIPQKFAPAINEFYKQHLNPYLNYHRPSGFATKIVDARGKEKKVYNIYRTPFEAYQAIVGAESFLNEGVAMEKLQKIALAESDNDAARAMQKAKVELFSQFKKQKLQLPTIYAYLPRREAGVILGS